MKMCGKCKISKIPDDFPRRSASKDDCGPWCTLCKRAYDNNRYAEVPARRHAVTARREAVVGKSRQHVIEYLHAHPCSDCGIDDIVVLEFDHLRDKTANISSLISLGRSYAELDAEMAKCEVVCANCHRKRTAKTFGWAKALASS